MAQQKHEASAQLTVKKFDENVSKALIAMMPKSALNVLSVDLISWDACKLAFKRVTDQNIIYS